MLGHKGILTEEARNAPDIDEKASRRVPFGTGGRQRIKLCKEALYDLMIK